MARKDEFPNLLVQALTASASNTITFGEINIGLNIFDKIGILIQRLEMDMVDISLMTATGDQYIGGIVSSNNLTSLNIDQAEVIHQVALERLDSGTAASAVIQQKPAVTDFSNLKGGGLLVPPKPLYFAVHASGLASANTVRFRMYFILHSLTDANYLELLETRRAFG
jgi:hypothetical protein